MVPRWLWPLSPAIVMGMAFVVLTRFVRRGSVTPGEITVDRSVTARVPANLIDLSFAVDIQHWVFVVLALVVCLLLARRYRQALVLLLAEPLAELVNVALKIAINRQLPDQGSVLGWDRFGVLLFPSGHVVRTTVTVGLLVVFVAWPHARVRLPAAIAALAFVGLVGATQVAVGGHLPLDVVGGFLLGGTLVDIIWVVDRAWMRRMACRREPLGRSRVIVIEVGRRTGWPALRRALSGPGGAMDGRSRRALTTIGLAMALVMVSLGVRAPQRLWHLAAQPTSTTAWSTALVAEAARSAGSAREWVARVQVALRGSS